MNVTGSATAAAPKGKSKAGGGDVNGKVK